MYPSKNSLSGPIQSADDTDDDVEYKKPQTFAACLADTFVSPSFDFVSIPHVLSLCVSARYFRWLHISWGNFSLRLMSRFPRLILNRGYHLKCLETCVFLPPITSCCVCTSRYSYNDTRYCTGEGAWTILKPRTSWRNRLKVSRKRFRFLSPLEDCLPLNGQHVTNDRCRGAGDSYTS